LITKIVQNVKDKVRKKKKQITLLSLRLASLLPAMKLTLLLLQDNIQNAKSNNSI
jgi:hypothetical protein